MKVVNIAIREYMSTAATKGFIFGAIVLPGIMVLAIPLIVLLTAQSSPPQVQGSIAVLDRSGLVLENLQHELSPERLAEQRAEEIEKAKKITGSFMKALGRGGNDEAIGSALEQAMGEISELDVLGMDQDLSDDDLEAQKQELKAPYTQAMNGKRLAIAVIAEDAAVKADDAESFGGYELFVRAKMDDRINSDLRHALRRSILDARYKANGETRERLNALVTVRAKTREITDEGERASTEAIGMILPFAFMILLVMSVMIGGQYLLTTTVEEKSSRVVEVLLSAVSPMQLMTGKVLGQMGVGMTLLTIYSGLGVAALLVFAKQYLDYAQIAYLFTFFVLAYFMIASLLAAVGSAVNDMREAQSLQTPVMMIVIVPYILWMPISRDPNSMLATVLSFIPPISPFVMMMRVTSTSPPPMWQIAASIAVSAIGAYVCIWFAAKVFRIGLLMYGKPPNIKTLIKWVRMA